MTAPGCDRLADARADRLLSDLGTASGKQRVPCFYAPVATLELTEKSSLKFCVVSGAVQDARSYTLTYANATS